MNEGPDCLIFSAYLQRFMPVKLRNSELGRLDANAFKSAEKLPFIVVLDHVRSMHNVGSVFRTCDAFRCKQLVLCGITGQPPHREITKTALGADRTVDWIYEKDTTAAVMKLKSEGYRVYAVEQTASSVSLESVDFGSGPVAFIFGNEIDGVSENVLEICDACIEIPQAGTKHSLNVSVAAGIVLWQYASALLPAFSR